MTKDWPSFDTDDWPDSESCQLALNNAMNIVHLTLLDVPASTTDEQHAFAKAAAEAIGRNSDALADLRPICLAKPPPNTPIKVTFKPPKPRLIETFDPRYAPLKLLCPGYSECTVLGKAFIDAFTGGKPITIGSTSFKLASAATKSIRVPLNRTGRDQLEKRGSLTARLTIRTSGLKGQGPSATTRQNVTIKLRKR